METLALAIIGYVIYLAYLLFMRAKTGRFSHLPLPPCPKGFPLIGNAFNMPSFPEWVSYHKLSKELDTDIIYLNFAGTKIVVLDTYEAAIELLERRSAIYSSRPHLTMLGDLLNWGFSISLSEYGEKWRLSRRLVHQSFHPTAAILFHPCLLNASRRLLNRILDTPDNVSENVRYMTAEVILRVTYGIDIEPKDDPYIKIAECAQQGFTIAAVPGAFLVDSFPILKYVPEWFPGAGFKRKAKRWAEATAIMRHKPYDTAKKMRAEGRSKHSFISFSLDNMDDGDTVTEEAIQRAAVTLYGAGTDTTLSAITSCILALIQNPTVLQKAQEELDRVIRPGHLPDFEDKDSLPYVTAITMEILRWRDVIPLGLPHYLTVDDEYKGYRIPAGTTVLANSWAMLHNEDIYLDPFTFNPDRFIADGKLSQKVRNPAHASWGFGRRICPGRFMAFSSVWITLASMMYVFDIKKAVDENGKPIEPTHEYSPGLVRLPKPFKCSITPRSKEFEKAIRSSVNPESCDEV